MAGKLLSKITPQKAIEECCLIICSSESNRKANLRNAILSNDEKMVKFSNIFGPQNPQNNTFLNPSTMFSRTENRGFQFRYLTRDIYVRHNYGDLNYLGAKIWEFFPKTAKFRTPN